MSKWITGRLPTEDDACPFVTDGHNGLISQFAGLVWISNGGELELQFFSDVSTGTPWMPIERPRTYVKPKRYELVYRSTTRQYYIRDTANCDKGFVAICIPTRDAAVRILNIFEEGSE
jgi:hypothetical protein